MFSNVASTSCSYQLSEQVFFRRLNVSTIFSNYFKNRDYSKRVCFQLTLSIEIFIIVLLLNFKISVNPDAVAQSCSIKFRKINRETLTTESLFTKVGVVQLTTW